MWGAQAAMARAAANTAGGSKEGIPSEIVENIRDMITKGVLAPGIHLRQAELAEQFGVSRVPVREALKLLAAESLVLHDQNRGFFVASVSSDEARQLYRIRQLVESEVLSTVEWPDKGTLAQFEAAVDEIEKLQATGQRADWAIKHRRFRESVFALSKEKFVVSEALRLWSLADRYRSLLAAVQHPSTRAKGNSTDRHLLEALRRRDRDRLLAVFNTDRGIIAENLLNILKLRGL
ncbi:MAG TPA: GntR family transcriptional regulator [Rhizomicrobium sp.]|jgi:DNA-binding GntR family transcriptional regulator|nr:GntR family transcriptional regulator [Rhizomicrobium sp.]